MRAVLAGLLVFLLTGCAPNSEKPSTPRQTAEDFRAFYFRDHGRGMPSRAELDKLAPLLAQKLQEQFKAAIEAHECHQAKVGNSEPPLVQGDLLTSLFEGATSGGVGTIKTEKSQSIADLYWSYGASDLNAQPVNWTDALLLERVDGQWRIADIKYQGAWDFAPKGLLSERLSALAEACR